MTFPLLNLKSTNNMEKAILLTKDQCPFCDQLKKFLSLALNNRYEDVIVMVHQQTDPHLFQEYVGHFEIKETPSMIVGDDILKGFAPQKTVDFLMKHFGKR
jgi:glutaredoxin